MRKLLSASFLAMTLLLILAAPGEAGGRHHRHGGTRVFVGVGPGFWYGAYPYPYWYYPPPYYVYTPPTVVVQEPPVYIQQQPAPAEPDPAAPPAAESYWYYCPSAREYYPRVPTCAEAWIKVPPRQE